MRHTVTHRVGGHTFVWRFTYATRIEALRSVGRIAADPEYEFSWFDAVKVAKKIQQTRRPVYGKEK